MRLDAYHGPGAWLQSTIRAANSDHGDPSRHELEEGRSIDATIEVKLTAIRGAAFHTCGSTTWHPSRYSYQVSPCKHHGAESDSNVGSTFSGYHFNHASVQRSSHPVIDFQVLPSFPFRALCNFALREGALDSLHLLLSCSAADISRIGSSQHSYGGEQQGNNWTDISAPDMLVKGVMMHGLRSCHPSMQPGTLVTSVERQPGYCQSVFLLTLTAALRSGNPVLCPGNLDPTYRYMGSEAQALGSHPRL